MSRINLISAVGTPLTPDETLHLGGLERLLNVQWDAGIDGVLIAGTMGLLQLLRDETYASLIEHSFQFCRGRGECLIGVGDAGFARTADRIRLVNEYSFDGVVAVTPYLVRFQQDELIDYYRALADIASAPLYLYDLPSFTGVKLAVSTVIELSKHPNIVGIKCSGDVNDAIEIISSADASFRVIVAQADQVDALCQQGVVNHLDGVFSLAPEWTKQIASAVEAGDWIAAAAAQRNVSGVLKLLREFGVFPAYHEMMNLRGVPGLFAPRPFHLLDESRRQSLASDAINVALQQISRGEQRVEAPVYDGHLSDPQQNGEARFNRNIQVN